MVGKVTGRTDDITLTRGTSRSHLRRGEVFFLMLKCGIINASNGVDTYPLECLFLSVSSSLFFFSLRPLLLLPRLPCPLVSVWVRPLACAAATSVGSCSGRRSLPGPLRSTPPPSSTRSGHGPRQREEIRNKHVEPHRTGLDFAAGEEEEVRKPRRDRRCRAPFAESRATRQRCAMATTHAASHACRPECAVHVQSCLFSDPVPLLSCLRRVLRRRSASPCDLRRPLPVPSPIARIDRHLHATTRTPHRCRIYLIL